METKTYSIKDGYFLIMLMVPCVGSIVGGTSNDTIALYCFLIFTACYTFLVYSAKYIISKFEINPILSTLFIIVALSPIVGFLILKFFILQV